MTFRRKAYLDNAASSFPKPPAVAKAMHGMMQRNTSNPGRSGHIMSSENAQAVYKTRLAAAELFGISERPENIIFTGSATHSINIAVNGLFKEGDAVIISDMEHNSVLRPLATLESKGLITLKTAKVSKDDDETVENFKKEINSDTKAIFVTHASNVNGKVLPIKGLAGLCKEYGLLLCLDASQTAGHTNCNLNDLGADILCTSGHKGLLGPQGTGILAIKNNAVPRPLIFGGNGEASLLKAQPKVLPEALESGTLNAPGIAGLGEGIRFVTENMKRLEEKTDILYKRMYDALKETEGLKIYSERDNITHTLAFNVKDIHSEIITQILSEKGIYVRGGYHCSALFHQKNSTVRQGAVRVSLGVFNTERDVNRLVKECNALCRG